MGHPAHCEDDQPGRGARQAHRRSPGEAVEVGLVDSLETSDNYLVGLSKKAKLYEIEFIEKKNLSEKFAFSIQLIIEKSIIKFYDLINRDRFTS